MFEKIPVVKDERIPPPPKECTANGCKNKSGVLYMRVKNKFDNAELLGNADLFTIRQGSFLIMKEGYLFMGWHAPCSECTAQASFDKMLRDYGYEK